jgi:hypothetical protein
MATNRNLKKVSKAIALSAILAMAIGGGAISTKADDFRDQNNSSNKFTFALWGDMPYSATDAATKVPALIDDINKSGVEFSVFDGDFKSGSSQCTNSVYSDTIARFNRFKMPMMYVPGDNEWTDCHRTNNGGYNNLERLAYLRKTMFNNSRSFGQKTLRLEHQGQLGGLYAENTRWMYNKVQFIGLNVPGSNNNKVNSDAQCTSASARTLADCAADNAEYAARDAANISYLQQSFRKAKSDGAVGVMVIIQADPGFDIPETESVDERAISGAPGGTADGFNNFLDALVTETRAFKGEVVLVHGDVHFLKIDKPLLRQSDLLKNFTRVETFGNPNIHWVKVTVDPRSRNVFTFNPVIVPNN